MKIKDIILNRFPETVIELISDEDRVRLENEEISLLYSDEHKALYSTGEKEFWLLGGVVDTFTVLRSPIELFSDEISKIQVLLGFILYTYLSQGWIWIPDIYFNPISLMTIAAIFTAFIFWSRQLTIQSIMYVQLLEIGEWGASKVCVPMPWPHSNMGVSQMLETVDKAYSYFVKDKEQVIEKLQRKLNVYRNYILHLAAENKNLLSSMRDVDKRTQARLLMSLPDELVEKYEKQIVKTKRTYLLLMILLAAITFILGYFIAGGTIGVEGGS